MTGRYAVYFVPADSSPLAKFGCSVFGRTATGEPVDSPSDDHPDRLLLTRKPALYGFHATLQAPFELAPDQSLASLELAVAALAKTLSSISLTGLAPQRTSDNISLYLPHSIPALQQLASRCVVELNPYRKPLSRDDQTRRHKSVQSERQKCSLERYGYAKVLDDFQFHMTLTRTPSGICSEKQTMNSAVITLAHQNKAFSDVPADQGLLQWLSRLYASRVSDSPILDRISICHQESRSAPFVRLSEWHFER
ncbi:MAG: DUF1045 domain-containing protein [Granulosicoccus sp.]